MRALRAHIAGLMAAVMVLTSGAMAVARGEAYDAAGTVIICTGHGIVVLVVDADGKPVERPHLCPDCVLKAVDPPLSLVRLVDADLVDLATHFDAGRVWHPADHADTPPARAPPHVIWFLT